MNKKGMMLLKPIMAFVIVIIMLFVILPLMGNILPAFEKKDTTVNVFSKLVDDIGGLGNGKTTNSLFTISEKYILIGFNKSLNYVGTGTKTKCGDFSIVKVNKPDDLKDKGALCLCDKGLLDTDADACKIEGICVELDYDVIDSENECGIFLLEGESTNNLNIKRSDDVLDIHK
ncbi:MAG: hypothetical protein KJ674_03080 [Nanoarchaeota archaeon]|nr:hypothetical protein [Nanoarchaeota archaeon]